LSTTHWLPKRLVICSRMIDIETQMREMLCAER
jgi:hypothetical protein